MAKSARSNRKKRVKVSRRVLLENQPSWVSDAAWKRQGAIEKDLNAPKLPPVCEKKTKLLMEQREERRAKRKGLVKHSGTEAAGTEAAGTEAAGTEAAGTEAAGTEAPFEKRFASYRAELNRLRTRKPFSRRKKYGGKYSMFELERHSRIAELVKILKRVDALYPEKPAEAAGPEEPLLLKSKQSRKEKRDPLAVKSGGVKKVKGAVPEPLQQRDDGEDMEEDSDSNDADPEVEEIKEGEETKTGEEKEQPKEKDPNVFDGGVPLKRNTGKFGRVQKVNRRLCVLHKTRKGNPYLKYAGKSLKHRKRKFEFKGIYQFYPKPQASKPDTEKKDS